MTALLQPLRYRVRRWTWALGVLLALSGAANALTTTGYVHPMQAHSLQGVAPTTEHCDTGDTGAINASADVAQDITSAA
ncbi:MAG TPA: hypothetical protein VK629_14105, partial [Steroidobacteraceae bacterium]|nr:hypothetical protein [Steroidobacteraceae bacterium]